MKIPLLYSFIGGLCLITASCQPLNNTREADAANTPKNPLTHTQPLAYLYAIQGKKTVIGVHNDEKTAAGKPSEWTDKVSRITGLQPALWSYDIGYNPAGIERRKHLVAEAQKHWEQGMLINIMMHVCPPTTVEPCSWKGEKTSLLSDLSEQQWQDLLTSGGNLNNIWKARLDDMSSYLKPLQAKGIQVLLRPFHEMNQTLFWWSLKGKPEYTAGLYRLTHDYLVNDKKLTNLTFQWNVQDFATLEADLEAYDPGGEYWDILSFDNYDSDGTGFSQKKYDLLVAKAAGKPIALGEVKTLPTPQLLKEQPLWTFVMSWSQLTFHDNTETAINALYHADNTVTLKDMPSSNRNVSPN